MDWDNKKEVSFSWCKVLRWELEVYNVAACSLSAYVAGPHTLTQTWITRPCTPHVLAIFFVNWIKVHYLFGNQHNASTDKMKFIAA